MFPRVAFIAAGIALATSAHAQGTPSTSLLSSPAAESHDGYRFAHTADGFQLVEHGIWEASQVPAVPASDSTTTPGTGQRDTRGPSTTTGPNGFRRAAYLPHVYAAAAQFGLPAGLLDALIWTESRYNPFATSKAGAVGLGQLMPGTAKDLGVANRFDPLANLSGAARYLRQMLNRFGTVHMRSPPTMRDLVRLNAPAAFR